MLDLLNVSFELGIICSLTVLGIIISFELIAFPDLTVDGSFTLGGSVVSILIIKGYSPFLSLIVATLAGSLAGLITGLLHTKLKITKLLSGILTLTALYTINLWVMGRSNISLLDSNTLINNPVFFLRDIAYFKSVLFLIIIGFVFILIFLFLKSEIGLFLRATGDNDNFVRNLGISTNLMTLIGLSISNGLVAMSGALIAQDQGFNDINMGVGTIVWGLAGLIIGKSILKYFFHLLQKLFRRKNEINIDAIKLIIISSCVGSILYQLFIAIILRIGLNPSVVKLATSLIIIFALSIGLFNFRKNSFTEKKIKI